MLDYIAFAFFLTCAAGFSWVVDYSPWHNKTLTHAMEARREEWMGVLAKRDLRMPDTAIMTSLHNGTGFFASTSLLGIGAAFTMLTATDEVLVVFADLHSGLSMTRLEWEIKVFGLMLIYAYAFFKFGWAYRLFNYVAILIGAIPQPGEGDTDGAAKRAARMSSLAGRHFNRGLRALFFSIGYLGSFAGPWALMGATVLITIVLARRQFFSRAYKAVMMDEV